MLTPQEVQEKKFVKAVFGGYDMITVDEFLEKLTEDYTALFKENTVLKNKLKVLVDTVEEYRTVDESMRRALLGAQKIAKDMVAEAQVKANEIMESACKSAETRKAEIEDSLASEFRKLEAARQQTARFIDSMRTSFSKQLDLLDNLPDAEVPDPDAGIMLMESNSREIEQSVSKEMSEMPEEPVALIPEDTSSKVSDDTEIFELKLTSKFQELGDDVLGGDDTGEVHIPIDFDDLRFGENYKVGTHKE